MEVIEYELQARYDSRASFYGKAKIVESEETYNSKGYKELWSYNTLVAKIEDGKVEVYGWFSQTTARHINEFLKQNGFEKMSKIEMQTNKRKGEK